MGEVFGRNKNASRFTNRTIRVSKDSKALDKILDGRKLINKTMRVKVTRVLDNYLVGDATRIVIEVAVLFTTSR